MKFLLFTIILYILAFISAGISSEVSVVIIVILPVLGAILGLALTPWYNGPFSERLAKGWKLSFPVVAICFMASYWYEIFSTYIRYQ